MELIHTLGIAIDPGAAKSGGAQASAALNQVGQAARATEMSALRATKGLSGLGTAFGLLKNLLPDVDLKEIVRSLIENSIALERLQRQLRFASSNSTDFRENLGFLRNISADLGLEFTTTSAAFAKFAATVKDKLPANQIRDAFLAVAEASAAMGQGPEHTSEILKVFSGMLEKGVVKAEDLRTQLEERLPGAFNLAASSMGVTTAELSKLLEQGKITANDLLPKLVAELRRTFGPEAKKSAQSLQAEINRLTNSWIDFKDAVFKTHLGDIITEFIRMVRKGVDDLAELARVTGRLPFDAAKIKPLPPSPPFEYKVPIYRHGTSYNPGLMKAIMAEARYGYAPTEPQLLNDFSYGRPLRPVVAPWQWPNNTSGLDS